MGVFNRLASILNSDYKEEKKEFSVDIDSLSKLKIQSFGGKGIIYLSRSTPVVNSTHEAVLPSYTAVSSHSSVQRGGLKVFVVAKFNVDTLWLESSISLDKQEDGTLVLNIRAPPPSKSISFDIAVIFPPTITSFQFFHIQTDQFKIISDESLGSIFFESLIASNTDAPISFSTIQGEFVRIESFNILDPSNQKVLQHTEDSISGNYFARDTLQIHGKNGNIRGNFSSLSQLHVQTKNGNVSGSFVSSSINVSNMNATITGSYLAEDKLFIQNENCQIEGTFAGKKSGITIINKNSGIEGTFEVGKELKLVTNDRKIVAQVTLLAGENLEELEYQAGRDEKDFNDRSRSNSRSRTSASSGNRTRTNVLIESTNASIVVDYKVHPVDQILLNSIVKTSGGSKATMTHGNDFTGHFYAFM